ncbi:hypothetical protein [Bradyrhizobium sp.]|uniref:hypothetical protein n=1 Tax=Bradyrhizobium sp. TaxID=376 RepID=UPI0039E27331
MNKENIQEMHDIIDNLTKVRGATFAHAVAIAVQVKGLMGMIATAEMSEEHRGHMAESAANLCAAALSAITFANGIDPEDLTAWADRVVACAGK